MGLHNDTKEWVEAAHTALEEYNPRTLRGLYYNLIGTRRKGPTTNNSTIRQELNYVLASVFTLAVNTE